MLSKLSRLTKDKDIQRLSKKGRATFGSVLMIKAMANSLPGSRFCFIVSNRVSKKATQRNYIKRQLREVVRLNLAKIRAGYDVVVFVSPKIIVANKVLSSAEIYSQLLTTLKRANLL